MASGRLTIFISIVVLLHLRTPMIVTRLQTLLMDSIRDGRKLLGMVGLQQQELSKP